MAQLENLLAGNKENHKKRQPLSPISCPLEYEVGVIETRSRLYKKCLTITVRAEKTRANLSSSTDMALSQLIPI